MPNNTDNISKLVNDFRNIHANNSISPESLGYILLQIIECFSGSLNTSDLEIIDKRFDAIIGNNASTAIDNFNEILKFLEGITDDEKLLNLLNLIRTNLNEKEDAKVVAARHAQGAVPVVAAVIEKHSNVVGSLGDIVLEQSAHVEVVWDKSRGKFLLTVHSSDYHPDGGDAVEDWSGLMAQYPTLPPYSDFYEGGKVRERLYQCGGSLFHVEGGKLVEGAKVIGWTPALIEAFNEACKNDMNNTKFGGYNADTGFGECNGVNDITAEEAWEMLATRITTKSQYSCQYYNNRKIRTNICSKYSAYGETADLVSMCYNSQLEVVCLSQNTIQPIKATTLASTFQSASKLRKVIPVFNVNSVASWLNAFNGATALEDIQMQGVKASVDMHWCGKMSYASLDYLVRNASNTTTITITVHADVYNAMQGQATYPFNGGSLKEWEQLLSDAVAKNISFATA